MRIAAIITTCDRPGMLARSRQSISRQTRRPDLTIVVDDGGSPVSAPETMVVTSGPFAGPGLARNMGARVADVDAVLFLDDDDEWHPEYVETVESVLAHHDLVLTAFEKVDRDGYRAPEKPPPTSLRVEDWLVRNVGLRGSNLAMRREAFLALGGFDVLLSCGEDMDLAIRAAEAGLTYGRVERRLVTYHAHAGPRLTSPGQRHRQAHRTWLAAQGSRLGLEDVTAYRHRTQQLFGVDPGPSPQVIWILGPPGAGKTTWAERRASTTDRVFDVSELMFWQDGADKGERTAKRRLVEAVRAVETRRPAGGRRLFITAGYLDVEDLGTLSEVEHAVAVVPPAAIWREQISARDGGVDPRHAEEHRRWAERFGVGAHAADLQRAVTP